MKKYCDICGRNVDTEIPRKNEEFNVLNDRIEVETQVLTCKECGEEIFCEELDEQTIENVYNIYRKKQIIISRRI